MNMTELMDSLFFDTSLTLKDMQKGLTNQNYLLELHQEHYVVRVPRNDADQIVCRHHETLALQLIADKHIDVETIYYDESSGYKVTRYLPDACTYDECQNEHKIEMVAALMKRFHGLQVQIHHAFDPLKQLHRYQQQIQHPIFDLQPFHYIETAVAQLPLTTSTLCHNDWVSGNILFDGDQVYLIDYEYAGDNDPLFDVMSFLSENKIVDPAERKRFYDIYFSTYDSSTLHRLAIWEEFHNYLWCHWAMMMLESRHETIYEKIAYEKYQALQKLPAAIHAK